MGRGFCLEVWGEFACFTRPEMKAERVSYDIITPSAAIGIFEAIFWKPEIIWQIKAIWTPPSDKARVNDLLPPRPRTLSFFIKNRLQIFENML